MALTKTNINYSGQDINEIVRRFMFETSFVRNFGAQVVQGVKSKFVWHELTDNIKIQPYAACPASGQGGATLNQREDALCEFMMTAEFENKALLDTYLQNQYGQGSRGDKIAQTELFNMILDLFMDTAATQWDDIVLNGDTSYTFDPSRDYLEQCDGYLVQWEGDAVVNKVDGTTVTASNVQDELDKVWNSVEKRLKYTSDAERRVRFGVSINIADAWVQAQTALGAQNPGASPTEDGILRYRGLDMIPLENLADNTMFATPPANLKLVYDDDTDFARFNVTDLSATNALCEKTTARMDAKGKPVYGRSDYITYYRI